MNISLKWLSDYVKFEDTIKNFSERMTMSGSKVEGYEIEAEEISGVVVGKVEEIIKHPGADSLFICKVNIGSGPLLQICTAAKNVVAGAVVPVAVDGSTLAEGKKIVKGMLRGEESNGMLCSLSELGLTAHDFPYGDENGIFLLEGEEAAHPLGTDIKTALGIGDTTVEFEITSNRPDCLSVIGIARETSATYKTELTLPNPVVKGSGGNINDHLKVEVLNPTLCPRYTARIVKNVKIEPSPRWMRERLRASGVRPINNIVDITNYVMLEYGQPMHAFDLKNVSGAHIIVRNAKAGEQIETLDGVMRTLSEEMLVIADEKQASAIAGVMGGELSSIMDDTNTIVFESANFNGTSIRKTSRKIGLRTESSGKFDKGLDAQLTLPAVQRACQLVELLGAGEVVDGIIDVDNSGYTPTKVEFTPDWINKFIGINEPKEEMVKALESVGFTLEGDIITVPSWREDVTHKYDIAEEVARFYGYDNIPSTIMKGVAEALPTFRQKFEKNVVKRLLGQGFSEIITYSFISPKYYDKIELPQNSELRNSIKILNPLGEDTSIMRTTAIPSMLEVLARNYNYRNPAAAMYELATEYLPVEGQDLADENVRVVLGMYGEDKDFYSIKGAVEELLAKLHITDWDVAAKTDSPYLHPGRACNIYIGGELLGEIGEVHPQVCENYGVPARLYIASLSMDLLEKHGNKTVEYTPLPKFPSVSRDLALVCPEEVTAGEIEKIIRAAKIDGILDNVSVFDVYRGKQIADGQKSMAFRLSLRNATKTMTDKEIDEIMATILAALEASGKIEIRK